MRRLVLTLGALIAIAAGGAGAGAWWSTAREAPGWPILVQQSDGNLLLVKREGAPQQLTTDADGQNIAYLFATPAPDGRSFAAVRTSAGGQAASLIVRELNGAERTLYNDPRSSPFYLSWAPDSQKLAFLSSSATTMTLQGVDARGGTPAKQIAPGAPSYFSWSPDSAQLMMHIGGGTPQSSLQLYDWGSAAPRPIDVAPAQFNAPSWLPDGRRAVVALQQDAGAALVTIDTAGQVVQKLAALPGDALFVTAPDAANVAYIAVNGPQPGQLHVVRADGTQDRTIASSPTVTFFWSPRGDRLAFLSVSETNPISTRQEFPQLQWSVLSLADGTLQRFDAFQPSPAFINILPYFDQYAQSIRLWNPGGTQLLYGTNDGVWMLDTATSKTQRVSDGVLGVWMK